MIDTGGLISGVLSVLRGSSGQQVGDAVRPPDVGWLGGEPNSGVFVPYSVAVVTGATTRDVPLSYADTIRSWQATLRLTHYGASRGQCDYVALLVRSAVQDLLLEQLGAYRVTGARWGGLGSMTRDDSVNPALWSVSDSLILMLDS